MTYLTIFAALIAAGLVAVVLWRDMSGRVQVMQKRLGDLELELTLLRRRPRFDVAGEPQSETAQPVEDAIPTPPLVPAEPEPEPELETVPVQPPVAATDPEPAAPELPSPPHRSEPPRSSPPSRRNEWEQWIGVRGAAVLGGIVLALAALLFLKFAIDRGLIPPIVRVIASVIAGLGAIWGSEVLRKRNYEVTANALAGSGVVILYAAFWAANRLYELIPMLPAGGLMILVTVACGALAWRYQSQVIAVLGLAGGFATPLLLAAPTDNPIGFFAYLLLLSAGLLVLARHHHWPILGFLGLAATTYYEIRWVFLEMGPEHMHLGLLIVGVLALLFVMTGLTGFRASSGEEAPTWQITQTAGLLLPFLIAIYFAGNSNLGTHLWATAGLMLLLSLAAAWISRIQNAPSIAIGAAAADVAIVFAWVARTDFDTLLSWEAVIISIALTLTFHFFVERDIRAGRSFEQDAKRSIPALVAVCGFFLLLIGTSLGRIPSLCPWLFGWAVLSFLLIRQSSLPGLVKLQLIASGLLGSGFVLYYAVHKGTLSLPPAGLYFALVLAAATALQLFTYTRQEPVAKGGSEIAAAIFPCIILLGLLPESQYPDLSPGLFYLATIILALLIILVGTRIGTGKLVFGVMSVLALEHLFWTESYPELQSEPRTALLVMAAQILTVVLFVAWPFLTTKRFPGDRWVWVSAALAPAAWFLSLKQLFEISFGDTAIGLLPLGLGALSLAAAYRSRRLFAVDDPQRKSNLAWFAAVAFGFLTLAIPLQLDKEWITIGWALEGFAVLALWKRLDHPGLKYFGLALLGAVSVRLIVNPSILGYYANTAYPVFNWLMYTYLIPAAALLGSASILQRLEVERGLDWETSFYAKGYPVAAIGCGLSAILVIFVWINLTIFDAFTPGAALAISFDRLPARDLTLSLAWAIFALILLASGMARRSQGLRWISLTFLLLTIGKVFLYDLGELQDLYRVASLVGLAVSLILVSLAYQKFVFRKQPVGARL